MCVPFMLYFYGMSGRPSKSLDVHNLRRCYVGGCGLKDEHSRDPIASRSVGIPKELLTLACHVAYKRLGTRFRPCKCLAFSEQSGVRSRTDLSRTGVAQSV